MNHPKVGSKKCIFIWKFTLKSLVSNFWGDILLDDSMYNFAQKVHIEWQREGANNSTWSTVNIRFFFFQQNSQVSQYKDTTHPYPQVLGSEPLFYMQVFFCIFFLPRLSVGLLFTSQQPGKKKKTLDVRKCDGCAPVERLSLSLNIHQDIEDVGGLS